MRINKYVNTLNRTKFIRDIMEARFKVFLFVVVFVMVLVLIRLFILTTYNQKYYKRYVQNATLQQVSLSNAPRGKIYDRNGKLLVDNVMIKTIYYRKPDDIKFKDEIEVATKLMTMINIDYKKLSDNDLIKYYKLLHPVKTKKLLSKSELKEVEQRKITEEKAEELINFRIIKNKLINFNEAELKTLYIYKLMNTGYSYEDKLIKNENVTDAEYLRVLEYESTIPGVSAKLEPTRKYLYGDTFKSMFGKISNSKTGIPMELKDYYLANGYKLNDQVGITNLEYQYENILRGIKPVVAITDEGYREIKKGRRGQDVRLTIDIDLQRYVESVLIKEIKAAKAEPNTKYYDHSFVIVTDPKTGEILAMSGKQLNKKGEIVDFTPGILTQPVTAGSIVKGASHIVGYNTGAIKIGVKVKDECIQLKATPKKCSWKNLGIVDDIGALAYSSNSFQFKTAMTVAGSKYRFGAPFIVKRDAFSIYRQTYAEFGLGVSSNISFAKESLGNRGTDSINGQLLDFAIGQYDTYTPIQISSYMSTLANQGSRMRLSLLKSVYEPSVNNDLSQLDYSVEPVLLNKVNTKEEYMDRVLLGLRGVMEYGTGNGYMGSAPSPAGKTGTSQSFIDTNGDNLVDKQTITSTFGGFAPYNNPKMAIVVISPNVKSDTTINFKSGVNKRIASQISTYFFTKQ